MPPIYEYRCMISDEKIERFVGIGECGQPTRCNCGNSAKRILSPTPTTFRFADPRAYKRVSKK